MKALLTITMTLSMVGALFADDKGTDVTLAGMTSTTPKNWKKEEPSNNMRLMQFALPKAEGDAEDAQLAVFAFPGGSGSLKDNLARQEAKFLDKGRKAKTEKLNVGKIEGTFQKVTGTYKKKPFPMAENYTPQADFAQLYVVFDGTDKKQYYITILGPEKTIDKHEKAVKEWVKGFK